MNEITITKEKTYILDFGNGEKIFVAERNVPSIIFAYKMIGMSLVNAAIMNNVVA